LTPTARTAAALLAFIAWSGLILQCGVTYHLEGSFLSTIWTLVWYFTIFTNILVAIVFTSLAAKPSTAIHPSLISAITLYIMLVGIIYGLLLHGTLDLSGGGVYTNAIFHMVMPVLIPIFWLLFTPKGQLTRRDPPRWAIYPIAYLAYALLRGEFTHRYPYPFLNITDLGWPRTLLNSAVIAIAFLTVSWLFVWIDSLLARKQKPVALPG
jgi:hypothetical protein